MPKRRTEKAEKSPLKLMLWTAIAAILFGLVGAGEYAEDTLRATRNKIHSHSASGDIVLVRIDDKSLKQVGRWPWPRARHADLTDALTAAGAKRIFFDISFFGPTTTSDDRRLAESFARSGRVYLPLKIKSGSDQASSQHQDVAPLPAIAKHANFGAISVRYNYQNAAWRIPYAMRSDGKLIPSFASHLAGVAGSSDELFIPDYSIDPTSIPTVSAESLLTGTADPRTFAGKDVIIGTDTDAAGDQYFLPGTGKVGGVYIQVIGAETLKQGKPLYLGWVPLLLVALAAGAAALLARRTLHQSLLVGGASVALLLLPIAFEAKLIFLDVTPGLLALIVVGTILSRRRFRSKGLLNELTGLPNLAAFRANRTDGSKAIVAAKILNYAEISAALPPEFERQLVDQIVSRLKVGSRERILYHSDDGMFAWFEDAQQPFGHHLDALYALFRTPARLGGMTIDLAIAFGVELGSRRSIGNRLASAFVAAEEAAHDGLRWKFYDPHALEDASWKLSMLSQLDDAVDRGEVWVAFQPKLDIATRKVIGAEALARWTHPEKGPIAATEFIAAAEQHDRIGKLTDFVLEQAVAAAANVNRKAPGFGMAVNLSARLLTDAGFTLRLSALLARHRLAPELLTLELTETAALSGSGAATDMLSAIRRLGVNISIDDYGTGLSTLEYLKKIPANEIKIDQSFVKSMLDNRSDRVMVQSTITLAHALGRKVVAEGVERHELLDALIEMGCDIAQGFIVGRPMSLESLIKRVASAQHVRVA